MSNHTCDACAAGTTNDAGMMPLDLIRRVMGSRRSDVLERTCLDWYLCGMCCGYDERCGDDASGSDTTCDVTYALNGTCLELYR